MAHGLGMAFLRVDNGEEPITAAIPDIGHSMRPVMNDTT